MQQMQNTTEKVMTVEITPVMVTVLLCDMNVISWVIKISVAGCMH